MGIDPDIRAWFVSRVNSIPAMIADVNHPGGASGDMMISGCVDNANKKALWETKRSADASIIVAGFTIPVHAAVVGAASPYVDKGFRQSYQTTGLCEFYVQFGNINTIWKILELIYLGTYSNDLCPFAEPSESVNELALHSSLYMMAKRWKMSETFQSIIFYKYEALLRRTWKPEPFLESVNQIFSPLVPDGFMGHMSQTFQVDQGVDPEEMRKDRIVYLVMGELEKRRKLFLGPASSILCQSLASSPTLLILFVEQWTGNHAYEKPNSTNGGMDQSTNNSPLRPPTKWHRCREISKSLARVGHD